MKKLILCAVILVFFVSCGSVTYNSFAGISGQIVDVDTHDPIEGASVNLSPTGKSVFTGSDGYFEFQELDPEQYTVTVQKNGYTTNRKTVTTVAVEIENITVTLSKKE